MEDMGQESKGSAPVSVLGVTNKGVTAWGGEGSPRGGEGRSGEEVWTGGEGRSGGEGCRSGGEGHREGDPLPVSSQSSNLSRPLRL